MQTVKLSYSVGLNGYEKTFGVYGVNYFGVKFQRRLHGLLNGNYVENNVGYRRKIHVDFMPTNGDNASRFFLQGFLFGNDRYLTYYDDDGSTVIYEASVMLLSDALEFDFRDSVSFFDPFSFDFIEHDLTQVDDDGEDRVLTVTYDPAEVEEGVYFCNLVDMYGGESHRVVFPFTSENNHDLGFGYHTKIGIDFGVIADENARDWLVEWCLWQSKKLDTTGIDALDGLVFSVVLNQDELDFDFADGLSGAPRASVSLLEKNLRTIPRAAVVPEVPATDELITDEGLADEKVAG